METTGHLPPFYTRMKPQILIILTWAMALSPLLFHCVQQLVAPLRTMFRAQIPSKILIGPSMRNFKANKMS